MMEKVKCVCFEEVRDSVRGRGRKTFNRKFICENKNLHINRQRESTLLFLRSFDCCGNKSQNQYKYRKKIYVWNSIPLNSSFLCYIRQSIKLIFPSLSTCTITKMRKKEEFTSIHVHVGMIEKGENNSICKLTVFLHPLFFFILAWLCCFPMR